MLFDEEEEKCAICGITKDSAENITNKQLLVNIDCGHRFCEKCIEGKFAIYKLFECPKCRKVVKKMNLKSKSLHELQCERDIAARRKVLEVYNKTTEDFPSLLEYNNFLEDVEDKIFRLANNIDVDQIVAELVQYQKEHEQEIAMNKLKRVEKDRKITNHISEERQRVAEMEKKFQEEDIQTERAKKNAKKHKIATLLGEEYEEHESTVRESSSMRQTIPILFQHLPYPPPQPITMSQQSKPQESDNNIYKQRQRAGGYDETVGQQRSWSEILAVLRVS